MWVIGAILGVIMLVAGIISIFIESKIAKWTFVAIWFLLGLGLLCSSRWGEFAVWAGVTLLAYITTNQR